LLPRNKIPMSTPPLQHQDFGTASSKSHSDTTP
jgi:hypothetical protein